MTFCNQPDRHEPGLICGYPLPCPYHTAIIDPPDVVKNPSGRAQDKLEKIARALHDKEEQI